MSELSIRVNDLGKQYSIGGEQVVHDTLSGQLMEIVAAPFRRAGKLLRGQATGAAELDKKFWALDEVSFDIHQGEVVGIIGRNGAGKSTLLKILSRIAEPTVGYAELHGRVGSLLEVGTGFHPELTGRENVYLNGSILGMRKQEIERRFDEIVDFAEIAEFIDTPVKHYSSGMYVRLAFAVAAHLEPEILLVDEVLAVGDIAFQRKCLGKMDDVSKQGRTVLFVSHNMSLMQTLCTRGIYLQQGKVMVDSTIGEAVDAYMRSLNQLDGQDLSQRTDRQGAGKIRVTKVTISDNTNLGNPTLRTAAPARFEFELSGLVAGTKCLFVIVNQLGQKVCIFKTDTMGPEDNRADIGAKFICKIDQLLLLPGRYHVNVMLRDSGGWQDYIEGASFFDVVTGNMQGRPMQADRNSISVTMPHRWTIPNNK